MSEKIATGIAEATINWLANIRSAGFEKVISEALLVIPAGEYLVRQGYSLDGELDTTKLVPGFGTRGEANYDIAAHNGADSLLLEIKYLKKGNDQQIIKDLVKLALPSIELDYQRLLLVGYHSKHRQESDTQQSIENSEQVTSPLIERIGPGGCRFEVSSKAEVSLYEDVKPGRQPSLSGVDEKAIKKWIGELKDQKLAFRVRHFRAQAQNSQSVSVLSVQRE